MRLATIVALLALATAAVQPAESRPLPGADVGRILVERGFPAVSSFCISPDRDPKVRWAGVRAYRQDGTPIFSEVGFPLGLAHRLRVALRDPAPIANGLSLVQEVTAMRTAEGAPVTTADLPSTDLLVIVHWSALSAEGEKQMREIAAVLGERSSTTTAALAVNWDPICLRAHS